MADEATGNSAGSGRWKVIVAAVLLGWAVALFAWWLLASSEARFVAAGPDDPSPISADEVREAFRNRDRPAAEGRPSGAEVIGAWELRRGRDTLTVTFGEDEEVVLDDWDAPAAKNVHVDGFYEMEGETISVEGAGDGKWTFRFSGGKLFFVEGDAETELSRRAR